MINLCKFLRLVTPFSRFLFISITEQDAKRNKLFSNNFVIRMLYADCY